MSKAEEKKILVVDDEADAREYLSAVLEDAGFNVVVAVDGDDALGKIAEGAPDFISLDLVMPGKSGIRFLRELRRNKEWARIPFVIVTAHAGDDEGRGDLEDILAGKTFSGPRVYLEKPVDPERYVRFVCDQVGVEYGGPSVEQEGQSLRIELMKLAGELGAGSLGDAVGMLRQLKQRGQGGATGGSTGGVDSDGGAGGDSSGRSVLVVDDDEDVRGYLGDLLADNGYRVRTAQDGGQAMARVREERPDLILLDLQMPEETGTGFYRKLRHQKALTDIPVIVISGLAGRRVAVDREVVVLDKPIDEQRVLEEVARATGGQDI